MEHGANKLTLSQIQDLLQTIRELCRRFQLVPLNRQLEVCENLLGQNPPIDVAILGQFKAGKSSFINSLIGKPVLPVGAIPATTAISRLQYGERERAVVRHFDGTTTEVSLEAIEVMLKKAITYVQEELATIEALLWKTQGQTDDIRRVISELQTKLEYLSA